MLRTKYLDARRTLPYFIGDPQQSLYGCWSGESHKFTILSIAQTAGLQGLCKDRGKQVKGMEEMA